jgi:hypothetical protein
VHRLWQTEMHATAPRDEDGIVTVVLTSAMRGTDVSARAHLSSLNGSRARPFTSGVAPTLTP